MKYLIFGDIHGKDLKKLEKRISEENPEVLVCLGDFDSVKSIREFMEIEQDFLKKDKKVLKVPGNHDYAVLNGRYLDSGTLEISGRSTLDYHRALNLDKEARDYFFNFVNSDLFVRGYLDENKFGKGYPFVAVHGGYGGNLESCPGCSEDLAPMWYRIKDGEDASVNFKELDKKKEKIMIRGHDHFPAYSSRVKGIISFNNPSRGEKHDLSKGKHIITPGAYFYRDYAIIDTKKGKPLLEFKKDLPESNLNYLNL
jgi:predicted phosphodiesterase